MEATPQPPFPPLAEEDASTARRARAREATDIVTYQRLFYPHGPTLVRRDVIATKAFRPFGANSDIFDIEK